ncbi:MAG TPA: hypothetical protein VMG60_02655 [Burkholderiaceae bacterium]|nr:hypothetical protein [Burkholderiaceae bacterium]
MTTMVQHAPERLSLLGGPLHRLGRRLGLVRGETDTLPLGLALAFVLWGVMLLLTEMDSFGDRLFSLTAIGVHVRLLVSIPLFFACEAMFEPRVGMFVETIVKAGVVPASELPALEAEVARTTAWKDAWLPEALCLLVALLVTVLGGGRHLYGASAGPGTDLPADGMTLTGVWYWGVCLTVFRFLVLRWLCRLALWCHFLRRVSRLELKLIPTHPDFAGGIGFLEVVHGHLGLLVVAISALECASFAEEIAGGSMTFETLYLTVAVLMLVLAVLVLGPLLIFTPQLWRARVHGLEQYGELASHYVDDFEAKWIGRSPQKEMLGTPDLQSLADLGTGLDRVEHMRWVPFGRRLITIMLAAVLLPAVPLVFFKIPLTGLVEKLFTHVLGL